MCRIKILCMIIALQLYLYIELQQKNVWEHNVFYLIFTVKKKQNILSENVDSHFFCKFALKLLTKF